MLDKLRRDFLVLFRWAVLNDRILSGSKWIETEVDFGSGAGVYDKSFTITDALSLAVSKIDVQPCGKVATGRVGDDWQWDGIVFTALPADGSFTVYANVNPGPVTGKRKIQYQIT